jgi:hypothetical protein
VIIYLPHTWAGADTLLLTLWKKCMIACGGLRADAGKIDMQVNEIPQEEQPMFYRRRLLKEGGVNHGRRRARHVE